MSKQSKRDRRKLRRLLIGSDLRAQFYRLEELRAFVAEEIPDLDSQTPWTRDQLKAVAGIYLMYQETRTWRCPQCGREVKRFGQQCPRCLVDNGALGPVDWDSVGA